MAVEAGPEAALDCKDDDGGDARVKIAEMRTGGWRGVAAIGLLLGLLGACSGVPSPVFVNADAPPKRGMSVAVLPFENLSSDPNAGTIVAQMTASELYARDLFKLMEETEVRRRAAEARLDIGQLGEATAAGKAAATLGVDAVLFGSVAEYRYQHGLTEEPTVSVTARLVRADGTVLWATTRSSIGGGFLQRGSLSETTQAVAAAMVQSLASGTR